MSIADRKADHIDLCATGPVGFRDKRTLLDDVELRNVWKAKQKELWSSMQQK